MRMLAPYIFCVLLVLLVGPAAAQLISASINHSIETLFPQRRL